jgi:hypothetical protein
VKEAFLQVVADAKVAELEVPVESHQRCKVVARL